MEFFLRLSVPLPAFCLRGLTRISSAEGCSAGLHAVAEICLPRETDFTRLPKGQLKRCLVCDGIQDPGNLGTLLRTAVALGWQGAFFLEGKETIMKIKDRLMEVPILADVM